MSRLFLLIIILVVTGCTLPEQAVVISQVGAMASVKDRGREPIKIRITCESLSAGETRDGDRFPVQSNEIMLTMVDQRPWKDIIGRHYGFNPYMYTDIILDIKTATIDIILSRDIGNIIAKSQMSKSLASNSIKKDRLSFEIKFIEAWVEKPAGDFWFKLPINARMIFAVTVADRLTGNIIWEKTYLMEEKQSVWAATPKAHEETMTKAYCGILESFAKEIEGEQFAAALRKIIN